MTADTAETSDHTMETLADEACVRMEISQIYMYPIKSFRPIALDSALVTKHGFPYDRRFMLLKIHPTEYKNRGTKYQNMQIGKIPQMSLFHQEFQRSETLAAKISGLPPDCELEEEYDELLVTYRPPQLSEVGESTSAQEHQLPDQPRSMTVPLRPRTDDLVRTQVDLYRSITAAYEMGDSYSRWFSDIFGFPVKFVYLGPHHRAVLGGLPDDVSPLGQDGDRSSSWLPSVSKAASYLGSWVGASGGPADDKDQASSPSSSSSPQSGGKGGDGSEAITFADMAPYLVVTEASLAAVSERLPEGVDMDITKFRSNIVLRGSPAPWVEDYWGDLRLEPSKEPNDPDTSSSSSSSSSPSKGPEGGDRPNGRAPIEMRLGGNCARCISLNVDFATGKYGTGAAGSVLKKLNTDRRVDSGYKYNPVFGRYGFLKGGRSGRIRVGDGATVTRTRPERRVWDWPM